MENHSNHFSLPSRTSYLRIILWKIHVWPDQFIKINWFHYRFYGCKHILLEEYIIIWDELIPRKLNKFIYVIKNFPTNSLFLGNNYVSLHYLLDIEMKIFELWQLFELFTFSIYGCNTIFLHTVVDSHANSYSLRVDVPSLHRRLLQDQRLEVEWNWSHCCRFQF